MIWHDGELKNPVTGSYLKRDSAHSFRDDETGERFPVIAEIPFLRTKREKLKIEVLAALDAEQEHVALHLLLRDQDDWVRTPPPDADNLRELSENKNLNLREAMQILEFGAVADYFAFRWSDPTFLSGLASLENFLQHDVQRVFELCCGIGHYLREFELRGIAAIGADVVFSKLWLARRFVAPNAKLICFDANQSFPLVENVSDAAFCHDAFYFLTEKRMIADELKRTTKGAILIGHAHNSDAENYSSGAAVSVNEYAELFENPLLFDDENLTRAAVENQVPRPQTVRELKNSAAIALVSRTTQNIDKKRIFTVPPENRKMQINPLLIDAQTKQIRRKPLFPSERYEREYGYLSGYLTLKNDENPNAIDADTKDLARRRILLDLPEKW